MVQCNYMSQRERGNIAIVAEVVIVILLVFGFLIAVKFQSKPKLAAKDVYPSTSSASEQITPRSTTMRRELPESVIGGAKPKVPQDEIIYTDIGFLPDVLNIQNTNRVIIFRNKSSRSMKIASEPHPSHTHLPSLNQVKSVEPGGVYWFAFAEGAGVYGYHNEINPGHYGVIIAR